MKKQLMAMVIAALLVLIAMPLVAQDNGQTLNIGGLVPLQLTLTLTPDARAQDLDLTLVGADASVNPTIAAVTITTNNTAGWELWVYSVNGSKLINDNGTGTDDEIAYTIAYSGAGTVPTAAIPAGEGAALTGLLVGTADDAAAPNNTSDSGNLAITYDQSETYPAGYYSDQIAVVLRAQ